ncbi:MAG: PAS domain-containing protein [Anaerolineae bacterium]|nr:PAS domain-containing protein [Anaerolineae bacterium]
MSTKVTFYRDTCFLARADPDAIAHLHQEARHRLVALKQVHCTRVFLALVPPEAKAMMCLVDREGTILAANRTMANWLGLSYQGIVGHNVFQGRDPAITWWRQAVLDEVFQTGDTVRLVDEGDRLRHRVCLYPVFNDAGHVQMVIMMAFRMRQLEEAYLKDDNRPAARLIE